MTISTIGRSLLVSIALLLAPIASYAQYVSVGVTVGEPPPPLPVYAQPTCPGDGYLWVPGYWAYGDDDGYYWVPGTWTLAPEPGLLWTPGYWAWAPGGYMWNAGYWGPHVGFYGGINYGFGYFGTGFSGGYWANNAFLYNGAVTNINTVTTSITNVYYNNATFHNPSRVSYNGGGGGTRFHPTPAELTAAREPHIGWTSAQRQQAGMARSTPALAAAANHGRPPIAATPRVGLFDDRNASSARGARLPTAPARAGMSPDGRSASGGSTAAAAGRPEPLYPGGRDGSGRIPAYAGSDTRSDRPPWASLPQARPTSISGANWTARASRSPALGDGASSGYRPATNGSANRHPSTAPSYSSSNARTAGTGRQGNESRYGQYGVPPPRQASGGWTHPSPERRSGGYSSPARGVPSHAYYGNGQEARRAAPPAAASPSRSYGGGGPRYAAGGSAPRIAATQARGPDYRH
jgi:hypothetical protein